MAISESTYKRKYPDKYKIIFDLPGHTWPEKIYLYNNHLSTPPKCPVCGKPVKFISRIKGYQEYCSIKCLANSPKVKGKAKQTMVERYGVENPFQSEGIRKKAKQTMVERYGVENPSQSNEIKEKKKQTCLEHLGVENPFQSEGIRKKARQTCLDKYGVENPFQSEEIKEKARQTCLDKYGVENPFQSDGIRKKARQTTVDRYGVKYPAQSEEIKEKIKQTCLKKYGGMWMQSEEIKEKARQTCLDRYGVENPFQSEEIKEKVRQTCLDRYGIENPFQSERIKEKIKQTNLGRYGVKHSSQSGQIKSKKINTCLRHLGTEYPAQSGKIKEKIKQTMLERYGVPNKMIDMCSKGEIKYHGYSNISQECFHRLDDILKLPSYYATRNQEFRVQVNGKNYYLDYYVPSMNIAVEFNGDWFHFNPSKYKADDVVEQFGHPVLVKERWEQDANRIEDIESTGINVMVLWESDYVKMNDTQLINFIKTKINE